MSEQIACYRDGAGALVWLGTWDLQTVRVAQFDADGRPAAPVDLIRNPLPAGWVASTCSSTERDALLFEQRRPAMEARVAFLNAMKIETSLSADDFAELERLVGELS